MRQASCIAMTFVSGGSVSVVTIGLFIGVQLAGPEDMVELLLSTEIVN